MIFKYLCSPEKTHMYECKEIAGNKPDSETDDCPVVVQKIKNNVIRVAVKKHIQSVI